MPPLPRLLEYADAALLIGCSLFSLGVIARLATRRRVRDALRLPPPSGPIGATGSLDAFDVAAAFIAMYVLPSLANSLLGLVMPGEESAAATTSRLAGAPALPTLRVALAAMLGQMATLVVFTLIAARRIPTGLAGWGLDLRRLPRDLWRGLVGFLGIWPWCFGLFYASVQLITRFWPGHVIEEHTTIALLMQPDTSPLLRAIVFFNALILAAAVEECLFRGMLQPLIAQATQSTWTGVVLAGVVFGAFHLPLYQTFAPLVLLGVAMGYARAKTGSLLLAICLHMIFNAKTLVWLALGAGSAPAS
ncbi:CAAX amino terminal protease self- immunity [Phycisphaerae bacterium RAS2]|nr:CAAX amino terminal protease self- immunity [Phycisphaerae bacterium RAS2]